MNNIFVEFLPPWVETGLQPAFYDKESGTVLQQTARMYDRVNMLIRMFNKLSKETKETVETYIDKFNELAQYVHDYFDNLDVQEEINNKLDEMSENGDLAKIIEPYLSQFTDDFIDFEKQTNWSNITTNSYRDETAETDYYITEIPFNNPYAGKNMVRVGLANDDLTCMTVEKPTNFSYRHKTPMVMNAGIFSSSSPNPSATGIVITDGVLRKQTFNYGVNYYRDLLCIKEDGSMHCVRGGDSVNPQTLINEGYVDVILGFYGLIIDGEVVDYSGYNEETLAANPRQVICRKTNGDYLILTCDGRTIHNKGLTTDDIVRILSDYDIDFAFVLDGGGSTGTVVKGTKINNLIDNHGLSERPVATMLYVACTADEKYFISGKINNEDQVNKGYTNLKYRQLPNIENGFLGNLFDKNSPDILINKYVGTGGVLLDYDNTTGDVNNDIELSGYIQIPPDTDMYIVNSRDWNNIFIFDENKTYLRLFDYSEDKVFHTPINAAYARVVARRNAVPTFGLYVGDEYDENRFDPYVLFRYDLLFSDVAGSRNVTLGDIRGYKKIKIFAVDGSAQQQEREIIIRYPLQTSIYTSFIRWEYLNANAFRLVTSRLSINQSTGVITFDREYYNDISTTPSVTMTSSNEYNQLLITRVEGYF